MPGEPFFRKQLPVEGVEALAFFRMGVEADEAVGRLQVGVYPYSFFASRGPEKGIKWHRPCAGRVDPSDGSYFSYVKSFKKDPGGV